MLLAVAGSVAFELGRHGQLAGWARLHEIGRWPGLSFLGDAGQPGTSGARLVVSLAVFAAASLILVVAGWFRAGRVTAEQVFARAGRAVAVRTALRLRGLISSIVLMVAVAFTLHPPALHGVQQSAPTAAVAVIVVAILDGVLIGLARWTGKVALLLAR